MRRTNADAVQVLGADVDLGGTTYQLATKAPALPRNLTLNRRDQNAVVNASIYQLATSTPTDDETNASRCTLRPRTTPPQGENFHAEGKTWAFLGG